MYWAILGVVVLSACTAEDDRAEGPSPRATPAASTPTPTQSTTPEQAAVDAYVGLMETVVEGSLEGATDYPGLADYATGEALRLTSEMLDGARATGEPRLRPEVTGSDLDASPPTVVIEDCMDNTHWVLEGTEPLDPDGDNTRLFIATVTETDGTWKVEDLWAGEYDQC